MSSQTNNHMKNPHNSHPFLTATILLLLLLLLYHGEIMPTLAAPNNETIYRISKQLCLNCLGNSLQFLVHHNLARAYKLEIPLMWDSDLEQYARWWAGQRASTDCLPRHSFPEDDFKLGENIYWGSGTTWTPGDAVRAWVEEGRYYDYQTNSCEDGKVCGHYTQVVWSKTRRIGCARVVCADGNVFMTCNYDPPGNYIGERPY